MAEEREDEQNDFALGQDISTENDFLSELKKIIFQSDSPSQPEKEIPDVHNPVPNALTESLPGSDSDVNDDLTELHNEPAPELSTGPALEEIVSAIDADLSDLPFIAQTGLSDDDDEPEVAVERNLVFTLAGTKYAVAASNVMEIGRLTNLTSIPNVPAWVLGVTNRRGEILSVIDLREFLGVSPTPSVPTRLLVVRSRTDDMLTGLVVEQVNGMTDISLDHLESATSESGSSATVYFRGVCDYKGNLVMILDLETLLLSPEIRQFEAA